MSGFWGCSPLLQQLTKFNYTSKYHLHLFFCPASALVEETGLAIPATVAFDHPALGALLACIEELGAQQRQKEVPVRLEESAVPLESARQPSRRAVRQRADSSRADRALPALHRLSLGNGNEPARHAPIFIVGGVVSVADGSAGASQSLTASAPLSAALGADCPRPVPETRWAVDAPHQPRFAACMRGVQDFDPGAFGIALPEAESMDPQQRLVLVAAAEALGGGHSGPLADKSGMVSIGATHPDHALLRAVAPHLTQGPFAATGTSLSVIAGRVSFTFGLRGPALVTDTACSSSLVAVHAARLGLQTDALPWALAGGVNLLLSPTTMAAYAAAGV